MRHFLYQGFNTDEAGRKVFDGMLIHTAGAGRGSFNHRFAQPSRDAHRFSAFFYPTDLFPFTSRTQIDPESGLADGLLARSEDRPAHRPKVFFTNTGYEYWGRAASLIHTSPDGRADVAPLPNERLYHLAGGQHFIGPFPPRHAERAGQAYRGNPLDFLVTLRALLVRLVEWVVDDRTPPASAYPTLAAGTLVPIGALKFPRLPDATAPSRDPPGSPRRLRPALAGRHHHARAARDRRAVPRARVAGGRRLATRWPACEAWSCWLRSRRTRPGSSAAAAESTPAS